MDVQDKIFAIADKVTKFSFEEIWIMEGKAMNGLQKEEVAEEMFFKGIAYILDHLHSLNLVKIDDVEKEIKEVT